MSCHLPVILPECFHRRVCSSAAAAPAAGVGTLQLAGVVSGEQKLQCRHQRCRLQAARSLEGTESGLPGRAAAGKFKVRDCPKVCIFQKICSNIPQVVVC